MTESDHATWEGDVNEVVLEEWLTTTTEFERVHEVLLSTSTPQYAATIAERARVDESTAHKHLERLTGMGFAESVAKGPRKQYKRSRKAVAMQRISAIHRELSREELIAGIKELRAQIQGCQSEFDASSPDDLAFQITSPSDEAWDVVSAWRAAESDLEIAKAALALYNFDPDAGSGDDSSGDSTERGSFADGGLDAAF